MTDIRFTIERTGDTTTATCTLCGETTTGENTDALITYLTEDHTCPPLTEPIPTPDPETRIANPTTDTEQQTTGSTANPGTTIGRHRPLTMTNTPGRTPNWTDPRILNTIIDHVAGGSYMTTAATAAGINKATLFRWLQEADTPNAPEVLRDFRDRMTRARAMAEQTATEFLWDVARGGHLVRQSTRHDATGDGYVVEESFTPPDAKPIMFLLERSFPQRWSRRTTLDVGLNPDGPAAGVRDAGEDDERLNELAERTAAALATIRGETIPPETQAG